MKQSDSGQCRKDYSFTTFEGREYYINICNSVQTETWALEDPPNVGGFTRKDRGDFSIGRVTQSLWSSSTRPDPTV
jgi:cation-dependent mannose-6-phosphate receptor